MDTGALQCQWIVCSSIFMPKLQSMRHICVCLFLALLFNLPLSGQKIESLFVESAIKKLQHAREYTLQVANLMPEEKYAFTPSTQEMSFGAQLLHLSANLGWLSSSYIGAGKNPITKEDAKLVKKEEIIGILNKAYDFSLDILTKFDAQNLSDSVIFFAGPMNKMQIINLLNDHQTHHRAQILVYLRLQGIKPPNYIGW